MLRRFKDPADDPPSLEPKASVVVSGPERFRDGARVRDFNVRVPELNNY